jgi:hypothetical protein
VADYYAENITEKDLCKWIEKVHLVDERCLHCLVQQKEAVDTALRAECTCTAAEKKTSTTAHPNMKMNSSSMGSC